MSPRRQETISGWGRYPRTDALVAHPADSAALAALVTEASSAIVRGNGRSYGDAALSPELTIDARALDRFLDFDPTTGFLVCEAGVLLSDILDVFLTRGWFPPVTPGTKVVTVGGMVASDVHGKNHHVAGSFCDHVAWIDLAIGDGRVLRCSREAYPDLFAATCGGMGLTGAILRCGFTMRRVETATIRQRTVHTPDLAALMVAFEEGMNWTYSVAWLDALAGGRSLGRSVVKFGEHARRDEIEGANPLVRSHRRGKRVPVDFPGFALSRPAVAAFNRVYHAAQRPGDSLVDVDPFFYPLDAIGDWNRIYGRRGFVQFQAVLPLDRSEAGLRQMLTLIHKRGQASFLATLKRLGPQSLGLLSFPMEGYTLALDFPANARNLDVLKGLDAISRDHGGRIYLTKDSGADPAGIAAGYDRLDQFRAIRRRYGLEDRFSSLLSRRLQL